MNISNDMFEDNTSDEITYTIDRLYEKYDHEKLPVSTPTPTPTPTPTITYTDSITPTITYTDSITPTITYTDSITPTITYTDSITPTITRSLTRIEVGFNEYNGEYVQMSVLIPDDKTLTGFAFDHSDGDYHGIAMAAQNVSPDAFIYEPSTIDESIKRCAFISQFGVKDRIDVLFRYTATRKDKNTQEYTGASIQGLHVKDFIAYDENRQEIQYEIRDALVENSALYDQGNQS